MSTKRKNTSSFSYNKYCRYCFEGIYACQINNSKAQSTVSNGLSNQNSSSRRHSYRLFITHILSRTAQVIILSPPEIQSVLDNQFFWKSQWIYSAKRCSMQHVFVKSSLFFQEKLRTSFLHLDYKICFLKWHAST